MSEYCVKPQWWKCSEESWKEIVSYFYHSNRLSLKTLNNSIREQNHWKLISGGRSNFNYQLYLSHKFYFIQIVDSEKKLFLPYERSILLDKVIDTVACKTLSPFLVETFFQSENIKIQEWFESKPLPLSSSSDENTLQLLANAIAILHGIQFYQLEPFDLKKHLKKYKDIALENNKNRGTKQNIISCYEKSLQSLKSYRPSSLCHYDLNLNNILFHRSSKTMKLIDWEYLCIGDPLLDVTALTINLKLSPSQEAFFIDCYRKKLCEANPNRNPIDSNRVKDMKQLNQCILALWEYGQAENISNIST